jgi:hypothetical protein
LTPAKYADRWHIVSAASRVLPPHALSLLIVLLNEGPPGHPIRTTNRDMGISLLRSVGNVGRALARLKAGLNARTGKPWIVINRSTRGRVVVVNPPHAAGEGDT